MAKLGKHFCYDGKWSDDMIDDKIMLCTFDNLEDDSSGLSRSFIKNEITMNRPIISHFGIKYDDVLSFPVTIAKCNGKYFTRDEISKINKYLTSAKTPRLLRVEDYHNYFDEDADIIDYFGCFTNVEFKTVSETAGIKFTFTCNAPYGFSKIKTHIFSCNNLEENIIVNSDEIEEYIYPSYVIKTKEPGEITVKNITDNNEVTYILEGNSVYNFNSYLCTVDKDGEDIFLEDIGFTDDVIDIYWLRLLDGVNKLQFTGNFESIIIQYRTPKKVGEV